ncbi:hypothetical protein GCM10009681_39810 [Luedemannella helvata]|uniref:Alpha-amylase n=1 Tax=Luedemannella helvata TaxID=349315 RepID=A0ABP4X082_9ACTN
MPYLSLSVYSVATGSPIRYGSTDADGRFRIPTIPVGTYKLRIGLPGGLMFQFWPGQPDFASGGTFTITAIGEEKVLNDRAVAHGGIAGHITTASGAVAPGAHVVLYDADNGWLTNVYADQNGAYSFGYLPAATYKLSVASSYGSGPVQFVRGRTTLADADPVTVELGPPTIVDEQLLPTGAITGVVTDRGDPVAGITVEARSVATGTSVYTFTDETGRYRLTLLPGQYTVRFHLLQAQRPEQWWPAAEDEAGAEKITVEAGGSVVADAAVFPWAWVMGHLVRDNGEVAYGATVVLTEVNTGRTYETGVYGQWNVIVRPGTYTVRFEWNGLVQWYHRATTATAAQRVVVDDHGSVYLEETLFGAATVSVTATDATTGAAVDNFCATLGGTANAYRCTTTGVVDFEVSEGTYTVMVDDGVHLPGTVTDIRVATGERVTRAVALRAGGSIEFTAVDARTGAPIPNACLTTRLVDRAPEPAEGTFACTDDQGRYTFGRITPDRYHLFAPVYDDVHGAQWVGPHGGVGNQDEAKVFTIREGVTTRVVVRFDARGTISGTVTDRATGRPVGGAYVNIGGMSQSVVAITDADGRYALDNLGPYRWKLSFWHPDYAGQWSGAVAERADATTVRVRAGATTRYDLAMRKGTAVTGVVSTPAGAPLNWALVAVYNARTHDHRSYAEVNADGTYRAWVLGPQKVDLLAEGSVDGVRAARWWRDANTNAEADELRVPASGTVTADFTLTP